MKGKRTYVYLTWFIIGSLIFLIGVYIGADKGLDTCLKIGNNIIQKYFNFSLKPEGIEFIKQNYKTSQYLIP